MPRETTPGLLPAPWLQPPIGLFFQPLPATSIRAVCTTAKYHASIEYCVPCDYSTQAFQVTEELLGNYQHVIDRLELITGSNGAFEVLIDGEPLFSKKALKRHPEPQEVLRLFKEIVGPQVSVYPR